MSEPFYQLLSPAASKYCRQVDRVRRSAFEEPMGLYTYDIDASINWNDPYRNQKKDPKARLIAAAKKVTGMSAGEMSNLGHGNSIQEQRKKSHQVPSILQTLQSLKQANHGHHGSVVGGHGHGAHGGHHGHHGHHGHRASVRRTSALHGHHGRPTGVPHAPHAPTIAEEGAEVDAEAEEAAAMEEARIAKARQTPTVTLPPYTQQVWTEDSDVVEIRHNVNDAFRATWENGIIAYIKGDWAAAKEIFTETLIRSKNKDGPSKFLLEIIDEHHGAAPADWSGYRMEGGGH
jgi:hypothetical protein